MPTLRFPFLSFLLLASALVTVQAQTYVGNLDGTSTQSTFTTAADGTSALSGFGWADFTGVPARVFGQSGLGSNDVLIADAGSSFSNYGVQFDTNTQLVANATYTLELSLGFVSAGSAGTANYTARLGTWNGTSFTQLASTSGTINRAFGRTSGVSFGTDVTAALTGSFTYTTPGSGLSLDDIMVRWEQTGSSGTFGADYFGIDNVKLSYVSAVPEPSTYAAFAGLGALGLAIWRRRSAPMKPVQG